MKILLLWLNIKKLMFFVLLTMMVMFLIRLVAAGTDVALNSLPFSFICNLVIWIIGLSFGSWGGWIKMEDIIEEKE